MLIELFYNDKPKTGEEKRKQKENLAYLDKIYLPYLKQTAKAAEKPKCSSNIQKRMDYWKDIVQQQTKEHRWMKQDYCISYSLWMWHGILWETGHWLDARGQEHEVPGKDLHMQNGIVAHVKQNIIVMPIEKWNKLYINAYALSET